MTRFKLINYEMIKPQTIFRRMSYVNYKLKVPTNAGEVRGGKCNYKFYD